MMDQPVMDRPVMDQPVMGPPIVGRPMMGTASKQSNYKNGVLHAQAILIGSLLKIHVWRIRYLRSVMLCIPHARMKHVRLVRPVR